MRNIHHLLCCSDWLEIYPTECRSIFFPGSVETYPIIIAQWSSLRLTFWLESEYDNVRLRCYANNRHFRGVWVFDYYLSLLHWNTICNAIQCDKNSNVEFCCDILLLVCLVLEKLLCFENRWATVTLLKSKVLLGRYVATVPLKLHSVVLSLS